MHETNRGAVFFTLVLSLAGLFVYVFFYNLRPSLRTAYWERDVRGRPPEPPNLACWGNYWRRRGLNHPFPRYIPYMVFVDVPMYIRRYGADAAMQKKFFGVWEGMWDAWERRDATQEYDVWSEEFVWRGIYFTVIVWGSILMVHAPTIEVGAKRKGKRD